MMKQSEDDEDDDGEDGDDDNDDSGNGIELEASCIFLLLEKAEK